jgi:nitrate reductase NapE
LTGFEGVCYNGLNVVGGLVEGEKPFSKAQELRSFIFLAVVMAPVLAVVTVSGYGFVVWMYQLFAGPPGPPG